MRTSTMVVAHLCLALSASAPALVPPREGTELPAFDVRATTKGLALGASSGPLRARMGGAPPALSPDRQEALARLEAAAGGPVVVRWNPLTAAPRMVFRYQGPLTGPDWRDAALVARSFLQDHAALFNLEAGGIDAFVETRRFTTRGGGLTVLHLEQEVSGIPVYHGEARFAITPRGEIALVSAGDPVRSAENLNLAPAQSESEGVSAAAQAVGVELAAPLQRVNSPAERVAIFEQGPFQSPPELQAVLFPMGSSARIAYKVLLERADVPAYYEAVVDGTDGSLLFRHNTTSYVDTRANVFTEHPLAAPTPNVPELVQFYDDMVFTDARWPLGWAFSNRTTGNAADAKEDWAGDNETTIGGRGGDVAPGPPFFFDYPWTNAWEMSGNAKADALFVITTGFYLANDYHDWLYPFGFDEAAGNWQQNNFGRGGRGGDPLFVDLQDAFDPPNNARDNANMSTQQDGKSPRAQFFLFSGLGARRDSGVDGDIVVHEFTHGLSNRLVGGTNTASCLNHFQSRSMGEGWSDYYALERFDDPVMGEYGTNNTFGGIRSDPYDSYPGCHTYNRTAGFCSPNACAGIVNSFCEVHDEGQLWAATLWEMRTNIGDPDVTLTIVTDGLKLTPCNPTFLQARDAILLADRYAYGGAHECVIWESFADRMMGVSATTVDATDTDPIGASDVPPYCMNQGAVFLDRERYFCDDALVATVHDANAAGSPSVRITASSGDSLTVTASGVAPTFQTAPVPVVLGTPTSPAILEVQEGDTITAEYVDASPAGNSTDTALVTCKADVLAELDVTGGCSPDGAAWPGPIDQILDAGEIASFRVTIYNREASALSNARLTLAPASSPMVTVLGNTTVSLGTIPALTGAGAATFRLAASRFLPAGPLTLDFRFEADGISDAVTPVQFIVPAQSDYQIVSGRSAGIDTFEGSDGGYRNFPWPGGGTPDEWEYESCRAASGTSAWRAGAPGCGAASAAEQDSVLETRLINPTAPGRASWYPTELRWNELLGFGGGDLAVLWFVEPNFFDGGDYIAATDFGGSSSGVFQPHSITYTAADTIGAGIEVEKGLHAWFDFYTQATATLSTEWIVDDVEMLYTAADAVSVLAAPTCVETGYNGSLVACAPNPTVTAYNTQRPAEMQFVGNGAFWRQGLEWNLLEPEFPSPTLPGERVVLLVQSNTEAGDHPGMIGVNGQTVANPELQAFGNTTCAPIPTPVGPAAIIGEGQQINLSWTPFVESGPFRAIVGYNVYRLDAETYPAASSTIEDYTTFGTPVGNTVGRADINRFTDMAPIVSTPPLDQFTYAIQPLFSCVGVGCTVEARFGGTEGVPGSGKKNLSTDSLISGGGTPVRGTVKVSPPLLASFLEYSAVRQGSRVIVRWMTSSELDTVQFEVWRGSTPDEASMERVGAVARLGEGFPYQLVDSSPPAGTLYYQVREVSFNAPSRTAPIEVREVARGGRGGGIRSRGRAAGGGSPGAGSAARQPDRAR